MLAFIMLPGCDSAEAARTEVQDDSTLNPYNAEVMPFTRRSLPWSGGYVQVQKCHNLVRISDHMGRLLQTQGRRELFASDY